MGESRANLVGYHSHGTDNPQQRDLLSRSILALLVRQFLRRHLPCYPWGLMAQWACFLRQRLLPSLVCTQPCVTATVTVGSQLHENALALKFIVQGIKI